MSETVPLAAITLASGAIGGVIWLAKYFANELSKDLRAHTKSATQLTAASKDQAKSNRELTKASIEQKQASQEVLTFMKRLNGTLPRSIEEKQEIKRKEK